jgi:IS30 family transposase
VHRSTISREIKRGYYVQTTSSLEQVPSYSASLAQIKADVQKEQHDPSEKIGKDHKLAATIAEMIKEEQYSPYAIGTKFEHERGRPTEPASVGVCSVSQGKDFLSWQKSKRLAIHT